LENKKGGRHALRPWGSPAKTARSAVGGGKRGAHVITLVRKEKNKRNAKKKKRHAGLHQKLGATKKKKGPPQDRPPGRAKKNHIPSGGPPTVWGGKVGG